MTERFFGTDAEQFIPFSFAHLAALAGLLLLAVLLVLFRRRLREAPVNAYTRKGLAMLMALLYVLLQIWYVRTDNWTVQDALPLQLCTVAMLLSIALLLTGSFRLFEFVYFAGIGGALQALFTPVLAEAFPHFWYFYFFIGHGGIVVTALFFVAVERYRPTFRSIWRTLLWLNVLLAVVLPFNLWSGANYMFLAGKPNTPSLLDVLGPWPWYLLALECIAFVLFILLYIPFIVIKRRPEPFRTGIGTDTGTDTSNSKSGATTG